MTKDSSVRSGGVGTYECARCGRQIGVRVPKGGDGSELRPYPHRTGEHYALAGVSRER